LCGMGIDWGGGVIGEGHLEVGLGWGWDVICFGYRLGWR
jgi:hypothetical protein